MAELRPESPERPSDYWGDVIFVHGLGGLVIKQVRRHCFDHQSDPEKNKSCPKSSQLASLRLRMRAPTSQLGSTACEECCGNRKSRRT